MFFPSIPPISVPSGVMFYNNLSYSILNINSFDAFIPDQEDPTPAVIWIHGGGFVYGDKASTYTGGNNESITIDYLNEGFAVFSINYRLLNQLFDRNGVLPSLEDGKAAIRFIIDNADFFNIDVSRIALLGGSAGAGISQFVAFDNSIPIKAIAITETQFSYDFVKWEEVFSEYNFEIVQWSKDLDTEQSLFNFNGISSFPEIYFPQIQEARNKMHLIELMDYGSPAIYIQSIGFPVEYPADYNNLLHHPYNSLTTYKKAIDLGIETQFNCPELEAVAPETKEQFIKRILS